MNLSIFRKQCSLYFHLDLNLKQIRPIEVFRKVYFFRFKHIFYVLQTLHKFVYIGYRDDCIELSIFKVKIFQQPIILYSIYCGILVEISFVDSLKLFLSPKPAQIKGHFFNVIISVSGNVLHLSATGTLNRYTKMFSFLYNLHIPPYKNTFNTEVTAMLLTSSLRVGSFIARVCKELLDLLENYIILNSNICFQCATRRSLKFIKSFTTSF